MKEVDLQKEQWKNFQVEGKRLNGRPSRRWLNIRKRGFTSWSKTGYQTFLEEELRRRLWVLEISHQKFSKVES